MDEWRGLEDFWQNEDIFEGVSEGRGLRPGVQCNAVQSVCGLWVGLGCRSFLEMDGTSGEINGGGIARVEWRVVLIGPSAM